MHLLSKLKKRAAALIVRRRRLPKTASASGNDGVTDSFYTPYLPPTSQAVPVHLRLAPIFLLSSTTPHPPSSASASACSSDSSHLPPSPTASDFSAHSSLCTYRGPLAFSSETECAGAVHRPYSDASGFLPRDSAYLSSEAAYEHDPFAKGAVRVVHRSLRRTGKGRRVLRPLETEPERVVGSGFNGREDGDGKEDEGVDDSGVYLPASVADDGFHFTLDLDADADEAEPFTPPRTSTPPPPPPYTSRPSPSPSSPPTSASYTLASASSRARAPTARTYVPPPERANPPQVAPPPPAPELTVPPAARAVRERIRVRSLDPPRLLSPSLPWHPRYTAVN
ncbi:hypothetical protein K438DRAFT_1972411 [Mycena galopus ATCC 62051]|nr:hypothetical protein K438DRAFT_1972411 [Mycena galopus ATCC 62051]